MIYESSPAHCIIRYHWTSSLPFRVLEIVYKDNPFSLKCQIYISRYITTKTPQTGLSTLLYLMTMSSKCIDAYIFDTYQILWLNQWCNRLYFISTPSIFSLTQLFIVATRYKLSAPSIWIKTWRLESLHKDMAHSWWIGIFSNISVIEPWKALKRLISVIHTHYLNVVRLMHQPETYIYRCYRISKSLTLRHIFFSVEVSKAIHLQLATNILWRVIVRQKCNLMFFVDNISLSWRSDTKHLKRGRNPHSFDCEIQMQIHSTVIGLKYFQSN